MKSNNFDTICVFGKEEEEAYFRETFKYKQYTHFHLQQVNIYIYIYIFYDMRPI